MNQEQWSAVDHYFGQLFTSPDPSLDTTLQSTVEAGIPAINVAPNQGKLLHLLARLNKAQTILEIGTLAGYSTIWLARALPTEGRLITLELNPQHAAVARRNLDQAGVGPQVEIMLGPALDSLAQLAERGLPAFDLVFIDADKATTPQYLEWALRLTKPGSLIIIDNVVRGGAVADPTSTDMNVQGIQKALAMLAANTSVITTALQTVGSKGYDGLAIGLVI